MPRCRNRNAPPGAEAPPVTVRFILFPVGAIEVSAGNAASHPVEGVLSIEALPNGPHLRETSLPAGVVSTTDIDLLCGSETSSEDRRSTPR